MRSMSITKLFPSYFLTGQLNLKHGRPHLRLSFWSCYFWYFERFATPSSKNADLVNAACSISILRQWAKIYDKVFLCQKSLILCVLYVCMYIYIKIKEETHC